MSKHLLQAFFPAIIDALESTRAGSLLLLFLFPDDIVDQCPEVSIQIHSGHASFLRQPVLFLMAIVGAGIGLQGMRVLPKYWSLAFGAYGIMNVSAIFLHCLWPLESSDTYPERYPFTWTIDTYMTGVSSLGLVVASLDSYKNLKYVSIIFWMSHAVGVFCVLLFYLDRHHFKIAGSLPLELWYLLPSIFAGMAVNPIMFAELFLHPESFRWTTCHKLMIYGYLCIGLLGIGLNQLLCRIFGTILADLLMSTTLVFGGFNLCFLGIKQWIQCNDTKRHIH